MGIKMFTFSHLIFERSYLTYHQRVFKLLLDLIHNASQRKHLIFIKETTTYGFLDIRGSEKNNAFLLSSF